MRLFCLLLLLAALAAAKIDKMMLEDFSSTQLIEFNKLEEEMKVLKAERRNR